MQEKDLKKYQNSFNENSLKVRLLEYYDNSKIKNPIYYETYINDWYKQRSNQLKNDNKLKQSFDLLERYLRELKFLFHSIIEFYEEIEKYNNNNNNNNKRFRLNKISIKEYHLIEHLEHLKYLNLVIRENLNEGFDSTGVKIKIFVLLRLDEVIYVLRNTFSIDISKSPLKKPYQETYCIIEKSTNQIGIIQNIKQDNYYEYFEITILFAQGLIKVLNGEKCSYKGIDFTNPLELEKYLKQNVIKEIEGKKPINFRQYLRHTLTGSGTKNIYSNKNLMNKTHEYCKRKNINMTEEFKRIRIELNN
jgi:hypothetical protein